MSVFYQITRPIAFLRITSRELDAYRFYLPACCAIISGIVYIVLPSKIDLFGDNSVTDYIIGFFGALPGFFIAALAAVATFQGRDLDRELDALTVPMTIQGDTENVSVTMRTYLCHMFAYLTSISFIGFFICLVSSAMSSNIMAVAMDAQSSQLSSIAVQAFGASYIGILGFISGSIVACTAHGMYFLAERIHQEID